MREWIIRPGDPIALPLAADARLSPTDYVNDQIWELVVGRGEPPALTLQTSYGLRARSMRIFPRFSEGDEPFFSDPASFRSPVRLLQYFPNALRLAFQLLPEIEAVMQFWLPSSQAAAGQITLTNQSTQLRQVKMEWVALLAPGTSGQRMAVVEYGAAQILSGQSQDLFPVFFLTGGAIPGSGSYPCLLLQLDLPPGAAQTITWISAALDETQASFNMARQIAARNWQAELAQLEILNGSQVEIRTGNQDWDLAYSLSQTTAYELFVGPTHALPYPSIVTTRQPDQGYSLRGDGSDYNHLWNGQTALECYYLAHLVLPAAPDLIKGLLRNFLSIESENGAIDWKPGLGQQRSQLDAAPLLADLAWTIFQTTQDRGFLEEVFPGLHRFFTSWFMPQRDRDQDGIPEWSRALQTGLDNHPFFTSESSWAQGVDPTTVESPDLCSYLYRECHALIRIAHLIEREEEIPALRSTAASLKEAVESTWNETDSSYHYRDRDTHFSQGSMLRLSLTWPAEIKLPQHLPQPMRLIVRLTTPDATSRRAVVYLHGSGASGGHQVEPLNPENFRWMMGTGTAASQRTYTSLDHVVVQGLEPGDQMEIQSIDFSRQDLTNLLPLWAGIPDAERAAALVKRTLENTERFWQPFGLRASVPPADAGAHNGNTGEVHASDLVHFTFTAMLIEGLLSYHLRDQAALLMTSMMDLASQSIKRDGSFHMLYHAVSGNGIGERGALNGLVPANLFLRVLGIENFSAQRALVQEFNPFPWPVTVKYRGTTILCQKDKTTIIFPDGQTTTIGSVPTLVTMDRSVLAL